jgi:peptidyl-Lys metalloendopeptidase
MTIHLKVKEMNSNSQNLFSFENKLTYQIKAKDSYKKDEPIRINFILENTSNDDFWILTWYTPFEGIKGKIFKIFCDGSEILYEGPQVKRGNPKKNDYLHIGAGKSVTTEVDLSTVYSIHSCKKECSVEFKGLIHDISAYESSIPRSNDNQQLISINGKGATFSYQ